MDVEEIVSKTVINVERVDLAAMLSKKEYIQKLSEICEINISGVDVIRKNEQGCTIAYFTGEKPKLFLVIAYYPTPNWEENYKYYKNHILKDKKVKNTIEKEDFGLGEKSIFFKAEFKNNGETHNILSVFDSTGQIQINAQPFEGKILDFEKMKKTAELAMNAVSSD